MWQCADVFIAKNFLMQVQNWFVTYFYDHSTQNMKQFVCPSQGPTSDSSIQGLGLTGVSTVINNLWKQILRVFSNSVTYWLERISKDTASSYQSIQKAKDYSKGGLLTLHVGRACVCKTACQQLSMLSVISSGAYTQRAWTTRCTGSTRAGTWLLAGEKHTQTMASLVVPIQREINTWKRLRNLRIWHEILTNKQQLHDLDIKPTAINRHHTWVYEHRL